jgi:hypothetical protein
LLVHCHQAQCSEERADPTGCSNELLFIIGANYSTARGEDQRLHDARIVDLLRKLPWITVEGKHFMARDGNALSKK